MTRESRERLLETLSHPKFDSGLSMITQNGKIIHLQQAGEREGGADDFTYHPLSLTRNQSISFQYKI